MWCCLCEREAKKLKNGHSKSGRQRYICSRCRRTWLDDDYFKAERKKYILGFTICELMYQKKVSYKALMVLYGISKSTVYYWCRQFHQNTWRKVTKKERQKLIKSLLRKADKTKICKWDLDRIEEYINDKETIDK